MATLIIGTRAVSRDEVIEAVSCRRCRVAVGSSCVQARPRHGQITERVRQHQERWIDFAARHEDTRWV